MVFQLGELYCGPGGLGLGANLAQVSQQNTIYKIKHNWAVDYDKDSCETYRNNICPDNPNSVLCRDARKLKFANLPSIDALAFGFPCNDFSIVGEQKGINGLFGPLYSYGIEILKQFQPLWFLAENVSGLKNSNEGGAFEQILNEMFLAGYNLVPHLYKFEQYGIPQTRHRIIIVGIRKDLDVQFFVPAPTHKNFLTCQEALECPPISLNSANNEPTKHSNQVIERLKYIKPGENAFTADLPEHLALQVNGATISQIYKRLDPQKPAYTVTGSGGGGTHVYHWRENRALTNRERARLQTFPDQFVFSGSKESVRKQIGMAVPPKAARVIFESILKRFANISYDCVEANLPIRLHNKSETLNPFGQHLPHQLRLLEQQNSYFVND